MWFFYLVMLCEHLFLVVSLLFLRALSTLVSSSLYVVVFLLLGLLHVVWLDIMGPILILHILP